MDLRKYLIEYGHVGSEQGVLVSVPSVSCVLDSSYTPLAYDVAWLLSNEHQYKDTNIPIVWIKDAGHNSNTDKPEIINSLIEKFVNEI